MDKKWVFLCKIIHEAFSSLKNQNASFFLITRTVSLNTLPSCSAARRPCANVLLKSQLKLFLWLAHFFLLCSIALILHLCLFICFLLRYSWDIVGVRSLGREDPLEKDMTTHSGALAWRIPWREEPARLQSMGSQRVGHDWATSLSLFRNWGYSFSL